MSSQNNNCCDKEMIQEAHNYSEEYNTKTDQCSIEPASRRELDNADEGCQLTSAHDAKGIGSTQTTTEIEVNRTYVCDTNHSVSNDNVSIPQTETVKENVFPDDASCSNSSVDCATLVNYQSETTKLVSSDLQETANATFNNQRPEKETEDNVNITNNKQSTKKSIEDGESSNVDENRNQKLQNDAHTQTDSNTLPEPCAVSQSTTLLKETKCTETAQTQTSFLSNSQLTQTVSVSQQTSSPERKFDNAQNKYRQSNTEVTAATSSDTDDTLKVVVEEIPSPNLPISLENPVKYMEQSENHFSATINGFYKDTNNKITANVKQEVISDCGTETS